jgi:azurin
MKPVLHPLGRGDRASALSRRAFVLASSAALVLFGGTRRLLSAATGKIVELSISSDGDFLAFKPDELTAPAGATVRLMFHHAGQIISQEHNWVLVFPGQAEAVDKAGEAAGEANNFVPKGDTRVIAATPLCGKGETAMVEFTAPPPGDYPFFCSNPGHAEDMHGILHIVA